jgi:hypothetical protein
MKTRHSQPGFPVLDHSSPLNPILTEMLPEADSSVSLGSVDAGRKVRRVILVKPGRGQPGRYKRGRMDFPR